MISHVAMQEAVAARLVDFLQGMPRTSATPHPVEEGGALALAMLGGVDPSETSATTPDEAAPRENNVLRQVGRHTWGPSAPCRGGHALSALHFVSKRLHAALAVCGSLCTPLTSLPACAAAACPGGTGRAGRGAPAAVAQAPFVQRLHSRSGLPASC